MNIKNLEDHDQSVIKLKCQLEVVKKELLQSESSRQFNKFVIGSLIIVIISLVYFNDKSNNNESNDGTNNSSSSNQKNKVDFSIISTFMHSFLILLLIYSMFQLFKFIKNEHGIALSIRKKKQATHFTMIEYLFYRVDFLFSRTSKFKIVALIIVTSLLVAVGGFFVWLATFEDIRECLWIAWTFIADPGSHTDEKGIFLRMVSFSITIGGLFVLNDCFYQ